MMMSTEEVERLWMLGLAWKCESLSHIIALAFMFLLPCIILNLIFWSHAGGPAWAYYNKSSIPGPRGLPIIGSMDLMSGLAHHKLAAAASSFHAKRLMAFSLGSTRAVVTSNPDVAREILTSATFSDRPFNESAYNLMFTRSIGFAPYGVYWTALRKIAAAHLFCPNQVRASEKQRRQIADQVVALLAANNHGGRVRDVLKLASLKNMMCSVFGREYSEAADMVEQGYHLLGLLNWSDHLSFLADFDIQKIRFSCSRLVPRVNRFVGRIIAERRAEEKRSGDGDFLDVLLSLPKPHRLSDSDMIAVLWVRIN